MKVRIETVTRNMAIELTKAKFFRAEVLEKTSTRKPQQVVALAVTMTAPGILVLTDMYYPGWTARVDDNSPTPALCVNHILRGVVVPEGAHTVRFDYRPTSLYWGAAVSLGAFLALVAWSVVLIVRQYRFRRA